MRSKVTHRAWGCSSSSSLFRIFKKPNTALVGWPVRVVRFELTP